MVPDTFVLTGSDTGDTFAFDGHRCAAGTLRFRSEQPEALSRPLVQSLTNGPHTLELISGGDGPVCIEALCVFHPPVRE